MILKGTVFTASARRSGLPGFSREWSGESSTRLPKDQLRRGSGRASSRAVSAKETGVLPYSAPEPRRGDSRPAALRPPGASPTFGQQARGVHEGQPALSSPSAQASTSSIARTGPARLRASCAGRTSPPSCSPAARPRPAAAGRCLAPSLGRRRPPGRGLKWCRASGPVERPYSVPPRSACSGGLDGGGHRTRSAPAALIGGCALRAGPAAAESRHWAASDVDAPNWRRRSRREESKEVRALSPPSRHPPAVRQAQLWRPGARSRLSSAEARV